MTAVDPIVTGDTDPLDLAGPDEDATTADTRVLFISGWGRSGSTLLDRLLQTTLSFCAVGELRDIWQRGPIENRLCSCGEDFGDCAFWSAVGARAFGGWDAVDAQRLQGMRLELDRPWHLAQLARPSMDRRYAARIADYGDHLRRLYAAIARVSGAPAVVESSKIPTHGMLLARTEGLDVRAVHLVRDSRGSAYSWQQQTRRAGSSTGGADDMPEYSAAAAGGRWSLYNGLAHALPRFDVPSVRVRYEDLVADPIPTLTRIARHAWDTPLHRVGGLAQREIEFAHDHVLDANPMRFQTGAVRLRRDDRWVEDLPAADRRVVTTMTAPLMSRYRYTLRADAGPPPATPLPAPVTRPSVAVVVPTRDRPVLLRRTLDAVFAQTYRGEVEAIVVYDQGEPDPGLQQEYAGHPLTVITNTRTPGLAGARNSGVLATSADWIAFCDDDDEWMPHKLERQLSRHESSPDCAVVVSGILVDYDGTVNTRVPGMDVITFADLLRSRVFEAHPSTMIARREALTDTVGLVDEEIPGSYGEDYDWMLRAARATGIAVVDEPLVRVRWHAGSFFADRWRTLIRTIDFLTDRFPEFETDPVGLARLRGRKAFAHASSGDLATARRLAVETIRLNPRERRAYIVLAVSAGLLKPQHVINLAHRMGRGV